MSEPSPAPGPAEPSRETSLAGPAPWGLLDAAAIVCFDAGAIGVGAWIRKLLPGGAGGILAALARPAIVVPAVLVIAARSWRASPAELGLAPPARGSWRWFLRSSFALALAYLALGAGLVLAFRGGVNVPAQAAVARATFRSWGGAWAISASWLVSAPLAEELVFRGVLYRTLRDRLGPRAAVLASAAIFAGMHPLWSWRLFVPVTQFLGGLVFAWAYERTRSLLHPALFHAIGNLAVLAWNGALVLRPAWVEIVLGSARA